MDSSERVAEALVVLRCQLGEREAFSELVRLWNGPLRGFVWRMSDGDQLADDIVQTVWLRVVRGLPQLKDPRAFPAWMFSIARRTVVDRFRYDRGDAVELMESHGVEDGLDLRLTRAVVVSAVGALPPLEREVVELHHLVDLSIADVAAIVGVPEGTVKSRLARARRLLAPTLENLIEGRDDD